MSELGSLLREHYEEIAPPVDVDRLADRLLTEQMLRPRPARGVLVSVAAAITVLLLVGGTTLLLILTHTDEGPVIDEPHPTTTIIEDAEPETITPIAPAAMVGYPYTILDQDGDAGEGASIIVGADGIPIVAYMHRPLDPSDAAEIRIATCADAACTDLGSITTVAEGMVVPAPEDGTGESWVHTEMELLSQTDGLPLLIVSESEEAEDGGVARLSSFKCSDPHCSSGSFVVIDSVESSGLLVASGPDDRPVIVRRTGDQGTIDVLKCGDTACSGPVERSEMSISNLGWSYAVDVDASNLPVIATSLWNQQEETGALGITRCTDPSCSDEAPTAELPVFVREVSAVSIDSDNRPVVLAAGPVDDDQAPDSLLLVACVDAECSDDPTVTVLSEGSSDGDMDPFGSMAVSESGSVAVVHNGVGLTVFSCSDITCSAGVSEVLALPTSGWPQTDVAIGADGSAAIAIYEDTNLGVHVCPDGTCQSSSIAALSDAPDAGWHTSIIVPADVRLSGLNPVIEVGPSGNPVIAYLGTGDTRDEEGGPVSVPKLVICADEGCMESTTRQVSDTSYWVNMALLPDGRPVVLYSSWVETTDAENLTIAWCADPECSSWTTEAVAIDGSWMNPTTAMEVRGDDSVVVVYQDGNYYVNVLACAEGGCEGTDVARVDALVDPNDNEWGLRYWMNSLDVALLPDGRPVISAAQGNGELRYVECLDDRCVETARTVIDRTLDSVTASVDVGSNGLPFLAYYGDGDFTTVACGDTSCADAPKSVLGVSTSGSCGSVIPAVAYGNDGNPWIAYWAPRALMLAACADQGCSEASVGVFANVRTPDVAVLPDGSPVVLYFAYSDVEPTEGEAMFGPLVDLRLATCEQGTCLDD